MNVKRALMIVGIVLFSIIFGIGFLFFAAFGGLNIFIYVPRPEVTYGEFPIKLTYSIDGDIYTAKDTVICEFDGFGADEGRGKYRKWTMKLKSGNENLVLLNLRGKNDVNDLGQTVEELYFYYGNPEYYMGDVELDKQIPPQDLDEIAYSFYSDYAGYGNSAYKADEAYERYKIKLIDFEYASPIKNKFTKPKWELLLRGVFSS